MGLAIRTGRRADLPDLDLKPGRDYRWRRPLSKPLAIVYVLIGLGMLTWAYFTRTDSSAYFFFIVIVAAATGGVFVSLLNEIDPS